MNIISSLTDMKADPLAIPSRRNASRTLLLTQAELVTEPSLLTRLNARSSVTARSATRTQRLGKRYEAQTLRAIEELFPRKDSPEVRVLIGPWFRYRESATEAFRFCQPDAVLIDFLSDAVHLIEIKLTHTADAYWQVERLYVPVVSLALKRRVRSRYVVTRSFDPAVGFPVDFSFGLGLGQLKAAVGRTWPDASRPWTILEWRKGKF